MSLGNLFAMHSPLLQHGLSGNRCMLPNARSLALLTSYPDPQPLTVQEMSPEVLDKYASLAGVGGHSHNFFTKGASKVHDAVLGCDLGRKSAQCQVWSQGQVPIRVRAWS